MTHERNLQASAVRWLNQQPGTVARVNGPGPAHVTGDPDLYGCINGRMFHIELKTEAKGSATREIQDYWLEKWSEAGALTATGRSMSEVRRLHAQWSS